MTALILYSATSMLQLACTAQARSRLNRHGCASIAPHRKTPPTCRLRSAQGGVFDVP